MVKKQNKLLPLTGNEAVANAMRQINPDVVAVFPITPQTAIAQAFAQFVADGDVDTELVRVESEHSAMSCVVGAAAAGARSMTATSSAGLALMWEILYVASSTRLPIVMPVVNRALSAPINIHCDHSDSMGARDAGWLQLYSEDGQEAYDNVILALKIAEDKDVLLPAMVCLDGFITSHSVEAVQLLDDRTVRRFIGAYKPAHPLLNVQKPVTVGPLDFFDYYFEHKRQQIEGMENVFKVYKKAANELSKLTNRKYPLFEEYKTKDAEYIIIALNSTCGTAKAVVDEMRKQKKKVGLLKIRLFRPFPKKEIAKAIEKANVVAVLDRSASFGSDGPVFLEVANAIHDMKKKPILAPYLYGLGGREIGMAHIRQVFEELPKVAREKKTPAVKYINLREK